MQMFKEGKPVGDIQSGSIEELTKQLKSSIKKGTVDEGRIYSGKGLKKPKGITRKKWKQYKTRVYSEMAKQSEKEQRGY